MRDRLLKFLNKEQLSSARFAEIIGVQPSSVSHILSGRNKPGFDFVQKMLLSYPSVNADWLILGKGNMYKQESFQGNLFPSQEDNKETLPGNNKNTEKYETTKKHAGKTDHYNDASDNSGNDNVDNDATPAPDTNVIGGELGQGYKSKFTDDPRITNVTKRKRMIKIVMFYEDKSFEEYYPENK